MIYSQTTIVAIQVKYKSKEFRMIFPCSGEYCSKSKAVLWKHSDCNGTVAINLEGDVRCLRCSESDFIQNFRFTCNQTSHPADHVGFNGIEELYRSMSYAIQVLQNQKNQDRAKLIQIMSKNIQNRWSY